MDEWAKNSISSLNYKVSKGYDFYFNEHLSKFLNNDKINYINQLLHRVYFSVSSNSALCAVVGGRSRNTRFYPSDVDIWINTPSPIILNEILPYREEIPNNSSLKIRKGIDRLGIYTAKYKVIDIYVTHHTTENLAQLTTEIKSPLYSAIIPFFKLIPNKNTTYLHVNPPELTHYTNSV